MSILAQANVFKLQVLEELATLAYEKQLTEGFEGRIVKKYFSSTQPQVRCCVYKEREITRERINVGLGKTPEGEPLHNDRQLIYVLEAACDGCDVHKIRITDNCKKCLARSCERACRFDAVYMGNSKAHINYDKCRECGMCAKACSYSAIVTSERPCKRACPTKAVQHVKKSIAIIDEEKCINCGQCAANCPFNAISDVSSITQVVTDIVNQEEVVAIVAPAIQGQFTGATLNQILDAVKQLGFAQVYEVSLGADMVTQAEAKEVLEHMEQGKVTTTSCCPPFYEYVKANYPTIYENNTSTTISPMIASAKYVKALRPNAKVVFIGPCMAKKDEIRRNQYQGMVDYVLTFEEMVALFRSRKINPTEVVSTSSFEKGSIHGRNYCYSGGVSGSIQQYLKEKNIDKEVKVVNASGILEIKQQLDAIKNGTFQGDVLEGMMCLGGCVGGVCSLADNLNVLKMKNKKENADIADTLVSAVQEKMDQQGINMQYEKK